MDPALKDLIMVTGGMLTAVGAILAGLVWLIYRVGKDHFISPRQVSQQIETMETRLRSDWHSAFARMERTAEKDREQMMKEMKSLDADVREAVSVAFKARNDAKDANHAAELLTAKVDPLSEVPARLTRIETLLFERFNKEDA